MEWMEIVIFTMTFLFILIITYYTTRLISKRANSIMTGKHIKVIDSVSIGIDKRIIIVKAVDRLFLMSVCGKSMQFLTEIETDGLKAEEIEETVNTINFKSLLDGIKSAYGKTKTSKETDNNEYKTDKTQDFKKNLIRLKNLSKGEIIHNGDNEPDDK